MLAMLCLLCAAATSTCSHTKAFTTADGAKYVYDYIPAKGNNATFALIHGYPATRHDWKHQIQLLSSAGYGIIAPDCLGYGDSDMPLDVSEYRLKRLAAHSDELFEHEHLSKVIGVGHDWGTILLSQTAAWHSNRFEKLVFISVGFSAPGFFFDIDALNFQSLESFGFTQLGYWYFLNSYNAADLVAERVNTITAGILLQPRFPSG
ncbi:hypothetical protein Golomagni_08069 [Golovinomyces magnicellulatus]|nr:hypothetical protein Golomagni_08069 [Golovinomyces magnicellulatus]